MIGLKLYGHTEALDRLDPEERTAVLSLDRLGLLGVDDARPGPR